jgi:hypothetical protein
VFLFFVFISNPIWEGFLYFVLLRSKQIVPWTILPVDRTMTVAELCKSIFVGDFTDIKEVGENNNPFVNFDLKYKLVHVTDTLENLNLAVNLNFCFLQKYGTATIFFLYGNKNVPSAEILRGRRCLRTRTFILFGLK